MLSKSFCRWLFEVFFFSPENRTLHFKQIVSMETVCMKCQNLFSKETICMKCQSLFSGKIRKNIIILLSAEFAQRVVKVNMASSLEISVNQSVFKFCFSESLIGYQNQLTSKKFNTYHAMGKLSSWQTDAKFIFLENRIRHFMQRVSWKENLHDVFFMSELRGPVRLGRFFRMGHNFNLVLFEKGSSVKGKNVDGNINGVISVVIIILDIYIFLYSTSLHKPFIIIL